MKHTISIYDQEGTCEVMFRGPDNPYVSRALWVYLVENLKPGRVVELSNGAAGLTRPTGQKVPPALYAKVMGME
jgi:hypothetical protein